MNDVAIAPLSEELFRLSNFGRYEKGELKEFWKICEFQYVQDGGDISKAYRYDLRGYEVLYPAYTLGFLLGMMIPAGSFTVRYVSPTNPLSMDLKEWYGKCIAFTPEMKQKDYFVDGIPTDAACKLAIHLYRKGDLKNE